MADCFVSYKREDRGRVEGIVAALKDAGHSVWWDADVGGGAPWRETIAADVDADAVRAQFEVNAMAPLFLTRALASRLHPGSKVALITSRMGSIGDNTSGGYYGYRMSKAALNAAGVSLAHDLKTRGVAVVILHPGFVRTEMTRGHGQIDPDESVRGLLRRIDELKIETTGRFLHQNGEVLPW